ncbi:unnamed protein product [Arctia plantaginis]|uniref:Uncharacterized protein n=1 Tax=Arctia plantaginis TaxID=874455 RepID=A0A8S1A2Q7_ARCPL|nr:unnamed protein product [Arctia plantaginis]CAB3238676.1 unnamed protein product [Arctia plantaginis]
MVNGDIAIVVDVEAMKVALKPLNLPVNKAKITNNVPKMENRSTQTEISIWGKNKIVSSLYCPLTAQQRPKSKSIISRVAPESTKEKKYKAKRGATKPNTKVENLNAPSSKLKESKPKKMSSGKRASRQKKCTQKPKLKYL